MKRRNRLLSALLSCLLLFSLFSTTALATEDEESPDDSQSETPVVVSSLEELQAAIAAAKDGDTIALSGGINIIENCIVGDTEKQITVVPLDETIMEASNPVPTPLLGHRCRSSQEITGSPTPFSTSNHYLWICASASFSLSNPNIAA